MPFPEVDFTRIPVSREHQHGSLEERLRLAFNALLEQQMRSMPGAVLSAVQSKKGTTSAKAWRTEAFTFATRGFRQSKAAAETAFTATTHDIAASRQAYYTLSIASGGTITITKAADQVIGTDVNVAGPDNELIISYLKIVNGAGGIWDATTDDLAVGAGAGPVTSITFFDSPPLEPIHGVQ